MKKWHYYNEWDPFAAEWLRNLIKKGLIPDGEVDTRSIINVGPDDVREFVQCHYFAGIAGWPLALKFAGWPEDRPVWTGSCPCQPFSVAGKGKGTDDERHLWPAFFRLIRECRPSTVAGEQVSSRAGREWLSGVFADLEGVGYAGAGADLCAPGVGAPHIRQRLYWVGVADATGQQKHEEQQRPSDDETGRRADGLGRRGLDNRQGDVGDAEKLLSYGREYNNGGNREGCGQTSEFGNASSFGNMADAENNGHKEWAHIKRPRSEDKQRRDDDLRSEHFGLSEFLHSNVANSDDERPQGFRANDYQAGRERPDIPEAGLCNGAGFWSDSEWRRGADGKERRTKPGVRLLVAGVSGGVALERTLPGCEKETHIYSRVGALRGFGNAIVPQLAAEFIKVFMSYGE